MHPEAARSILQLDFPEFDVQRMHDLAEKNRQGTIDESELEQVQTYMRIGTTLSLLKSKARTSIARSEGN